MSENAEKNGRINISRLSVPFSILVFVVIWTSGIVVWALERESGVKTNLSNLEGRMLITENNSERIENDLIACIADTRQNDRRWISIEKKLEYVAQTVSEIKQDVKEHKKMTRP